MFVSSSGSMLGRRRRRSVVVLTRKQWPCSSHGTSPTRLIPTRLTTYSSTWPRPPTSPSNRPASSSPTAGFEPATHSPTTAPSTPNVFAVSSDSSLPPYHVPWPHLESTLPLRQQSTRLYRRLSLQQPPTVELGSTPASSTCRLTPLHCHVTLLLHGLTLPLRQC
jgi:hypothetical protein